MYSICLETRIGVASSSDYGILNSRDRAGIPIRLLFRSRISV